MACGSSQNWEPFTLRYQNPAQKRMPAIGLGTFRIADPDVKDAVDTALRSGYRCFDTAAVYKNESSIGATIQAFMKEKDLQREEFFITSKLSNADHGNKKRVKEAYEKTCSNLGFEPDLYLIHFPGAAKLNPKDARNKEMRHTAWSAMVELFDTNQVSAIGVSNFTVRHLEELIQEFHNDIPAINQVEYHPMYHDEVLHEFCHQNDILLQGYSSLGGTNNSTLLLKHPTVKAIAEAHCVKPAQVLLTWSLQKGVAVIPKSTEPRHIKENIDLQFKLTIEQVQKLDHLAEKQVKVAWDPQHVF